MFIRKTHKLQLTVDGDLADLEEARMRSAEQENSRQKPALSSEIFASLNFIKLKNKTRPEIETEFSLTNLGGPNVPIQSIHSMVEGLQRRSADQLHPATSMSSNPAMRRQTGAS